MIATDFTLQFHLQHKLLSLQELGAAWDLSLSQIPFPTVCSMPDNSQNVTTPCNPTLTQDVELECIDIVGQTDDMMAVSEVAKNIDEAEECDSDTGGDDSIDIYDLE
jgi:hypothetical protein